MAGAQHPPPPPVARKTNSYTIVPQGALGVSREWVLNKCVIVKDKGNNGEGGLLQKGSREGCLAGTFNPRSGKAEMSPGID